jgi:hypothetical protein
VQRVLVAAFADDLDGYFELDFTSNGPGLFPGGTGKRLTLAWNTTADDLAFLLSSLVDTGAVAVSRADAGFAEPARADELPAPFKSGYAWDVTFQSQRGPLPLLLLNPTPPFQPLTASGGVVAVVHAVTKGVAPPLTAAFEGLAQGVTYAARLSVVNAAGTSVTTMARAPYAVDGSSGPPGSNLYGQGVLPLAAAVRAAPLPPTSLTASPLSSTSMAVTFGAADPQAAEVDAYRVEWSTDASFGLSEVKAVTVVNRLPGALDTYGHFTLAYGGRTTVPLLPDASAADVALALTDLGTTSGPVQVCEHALTRPYHPKVPSLTRRMFLVLDFELLFFKSMSACVCLEGPNGRASPILSLRLCLPRSETFGDAPPPLFFKVTRDAERLHPGYGYTWTITFASAVGPIAKAGFLCRSCVSGFDGESVSAANAHSPI